MNRQSLVELLGDEEIALSVCEAFLADSESFICDLNKLSSGEVSLAEGTSLLHKIKGASSIFGESQFFLRIKDIYSKIKKQEIVVLTSHFSSISEDLRQFSNEIKTLQSELMKKNDV